MSCHLTQSQFDTLAMLRNKTCAAISANSVDEIHRAIGMVQGYLIGLHAAGEIDAGDVQSLETEALANVQFLLNARRASQ